MLKSYAEIRSWRKNSWFMAIVLCLALLWTLPVVSGEAATIYVDSYAEGICDGSSWTNAFSDLQSALTSEDCEIWVAAGTYRPTDTTDRGASFRLKNGVALYGGFAGGEISVDQRNSSVNVTILTGNIGSSDISSDNSYHVVSNLKVDSTAGIDGFTITAGNADGDNDNNRGAGMYNNASSPTVTNCTFSKNAANPAGGGMYNYGNSSPTVTNCTFSENSANRTNITPGNGGGMFNGNSSKPVVTNCTFSGNNATNDGGGMYNYSSSPVVTNCTFSGNSATNNGGGMCNVVNSTPTVKNCIFWDNPGGEIYNDNSNPTLSYCVVSGDYPGTNIISSDPMLMDLADNGGPTWTCALGKGSSAIDAGLTIDVASKDQRGLARPQPQGSSYDIGAYEYGGFILTIAKDGTGTGEVSPDAGKHVYVSNTVITLLASADINSNFASWSGDLGGYATPLSVTMSKDISVTANFTLKSFTIMTSADTGGTVSPEGDNLVPWDEDFTVEISADTGYVISDLCVDDLLRGASEKYSFENVSSDHTLVASFKKVSPAPTPDPDPSPDPYPDPDPEPSPDPDPTPSPDPAGFSLVPDSSDALYALVNGTVSLDLPEELSGISFDSFCSVDVVPSSEIEIVLSGDFKDVQASADLYGTFITGISFDISATKSPDLDHIGVLPLDVSLNISKDRLSAACIETIENGEKSLDTTDSFLGEVDIFKIIGSEAHSLTDIAGGTTVPLSDFFTVTRDESGNFYVAFGLLIVDASAGDSPPVQAVTVSGDCRFMVFDGKTDGRFTDPLVAVERSEDVDRITGGGGCSAVALLPGMMLLSVPLFFLGKKR